MSRDIRSEFQNQIPASHGTGWVNGCLVRGSEKCSLSSSEAGGCWEYEDDLHLVHGVLKARSVLLLVVGWVLMRK